MRRLKTRIVTILFVCCILMVSMLFYFMLIFDDKKIENALINNSRSNVIVFGFSEVRKENLTLKELYQRKINIKLSSRPKVNDNELKRSDEFVNSFVDSLKNDLNDGPDDQNKEWKKIWLMPRKWVRARQIVPEKATGLSSILKALQKSKIIKSDVSRKGTQLKLLLTLDGGQQALFKPKRFARDYITDDIYSGADRHNGEIIGFHLSRILNMRYAPIVASRIVDVAKEIKSVASPSLLATFITETKNNQSKECFYGECYYCNEYDLLCPDDNGMLEGSIILMLPTQFQLQKLRHPWQRTYKKNLKAQWEMDSHYCFSVMKTNALRPRVLDFVDAAIFDYLIGNADRHHYEVFKDVSNSALLLIDNGKSFGDPNHDELTILYPLLQCCVIRNSTYQHLKMLSMSNAMKLSKIIEHLLSSDILWPLLTIEHLEALNRRLLNVMASIEICFDSFNKNYVLKN